MSAISDRLFVVIPVIFTLISSTEGGIHCYKCTTTKPPMYSNETVRLCSEFDYSEKFIVYCPFSTFCMKRYYTAKIPAPVNATERDCAYQKYMTQNYKNGRWEPEVIIEEPYNEGCSTVDDKGFRTSTTVECYCKSYLCNTSNTLISNFTLKAVIIITINFFFS